MKAYSGLAEMEWYNTGTIEMMTVTLMVAGAGSRGGGTGHRGAGGAATVAVLAVVSVAVLCWRGKANLEYL